MGQRQWIDIEIQEPKDPHCFQVSKFITRLLRNSKQVNREEDARVHYDQVIDESKKKLSDDSGYWSHEMKEQFANAPYWSLQAMVTSNFLLVEERRWIDIKTQVFSSVEGCDTTITARSNNSSNWTEQSITTTSLKNAGRSSSSMLRNGQLKIGCQLWQKVEEKRKGFNIA